MGAVFFLLMVFPFLLFAPLLFVAVGMLLFVRPEGLRPPWWDWGMDDSKPALKADAAPEIPAPVEDHAAPVEAETSCVVARETAAKTARPRW